MAALPVLIRCWLSTHCRVELQDRRGRSQLMECTACARSGVSPAIDGASARRAGMRGGPPIPQFTCIQSRPSAINSARVELPLLSVVYS